MVGIYKITNPNNEVYIGGTRNTRLRYNEYNCGAKKTQRLIYGSIQLFGWKAHAFEIVHELPKDVSNEVLDRYEQIYMDFYKDAGFILLNLRGAGKNGKHSNESLKLMAAIKTGKVASDETKRKLSGVQAGGKHWGAKRVIDTETGTIYACGKDAAQAVGMAYSTLRNRLNGQKTNKTTLKYL